MRASVVQREVFLMGLSPRHKGFHYISDAICEAIDAGGRFTLPSDGTSEQENADRCMRYAIRYAWDVNNGRIHGLFPDADFPPTPVEFIHAMLWKLDE